MRIYQQLQIIDIIYTDFSNSFFGKFLIFMENYNFWFEISYKMVIGKAAKKVWKAYILQIKKISPFFSKSIDVLCVPQYSTMSIH